MKYITAVDIGTHNIKGIVAEIKKDGSIDIVRVSKKKSAGMRRGEIVYPDETVKGLFDVLNDIKRFDGRAIKNLVFGISGVKSKLNFSKGMVSIPRPDNEILQEDADRVIKEAIAVTLPAGWQIIHSFPKEFVVDDITVDGINVVGLSGRKLEANVALISVFSSIYKNFLKVAKLVLGKKSEFDGSLIFSPLAAGRAVLTRNQKELGVVLIDIGFETTSVTVYQDGKLLFMKVLPVGSGNITNDLAIGLKCLPETAEAVKLEFGFASSREVSIKDKIDISKFEKNRHAEISKKYIAEIIEARTREIFGLVNAELKSIGLSGKLPAGSVITGGGAKMKGVVGVARDELRIASQIGLPQRKNFKISDIKVVDIIDDPEMSVSCGLVLQFLDISGKGRSFSDQIAMSSYNISESYFKKLLKILSMSD